ncbi:ATP-binding cassette sub-family A member 9-like [Bradysia coprophila]|uniref:ATP-binding cassette sub-family A member 9-like n=1 Tax=Bradysia coprophila TaxID=38358 RepID=UPI00187D9774|nr:ATP-binding cassette sub-family A member 9-like [Bradysia coprophila]XP_037043269.1 ATP-binding cassette sub-family A member 9-like [Bradysia coprophila]
MVNEYMGTSSFMQQLRATLIRNVRLKLRDSRKTIAEVFLPLYTLGTLIVLKILIPNPNFPAITTPQEARLFEHFKLDANHTIAVLPHWNSSTTKPFLDSVNDLWLNMSYGPGLHEINWMFYETQEDLLGAYWRDPNAMPMAVIFHSDDPYNGPLKYEIRTNPSFVGTPPTTELFSSLAVCRQTESSWTSVFPIEAGKSCPCNQYYYSGFIALQTLLDYTKIRIASANLKLQVPMITLEMFPKEAYTGNWMVAFRVVIPIYMVMALSQFITYLLILIVGEKENHIKEGLKIMGLRDSVFWLAWFIIYGVFVFFLTGVSVVLLFSLGVFQYTNYLPVFVLILLYSFSVILIGFMITPFFDNSRTAGILGNFAVNIMSLLYFIQVFLDDSDTSATLWIVSLISPTGFALAMDKILVLDISGQGVTLDNLWSGPGIPLGGSIFMMAIDILLYAGLAYYFDSVIPSDYGTKRSPLFCFSRKFWCNNKIPKVPLLNGESASSFNNIDEHTRDVEPVSREMRGKEAIRIVDLYKSFNSCRKPQVKAVNGINLTIYEGQITAILGHNGAGKSTLFNILTGLTSPSSGTAYVFGYDIRDPNDMTMIRRMTGVCPQHDILFDQLTAKEHLYFFAAVRGIPKSEIRDEVHKTLRDIDLQDTANLRVKNLSGGQKRKLSVGIAIIGDPKIIILDEPTAGVDPYSRRHMWSILQNRKHGKVILLTTHFMDEADILADRKAVVSRGRLRCCGSSLFLKNKFGIGYHLTLVLDTNARETGITKLVNQHVPKAERARRHGRELSYILPHDAVDFFAPLFSDIESEIVTKTQRLGICSYGVSMTTLEEVFLHLETQREEEDVPGNMENLSKKMVRNRALSRSLSLQGRSNSYESLQNEINHLTDTNGKGTIRSLPDERTNQMFPSIVTGDKGIIESVIPVKESVAIQPSKSSWMELNDVKLIPSVPRTLFALLKLRVIILLRDLQRLYLMIILPLAFTALGLYLNSIQVILPAMRSIVLDNNTYDQENGRIAIHDSTVNENGDFEYMVQMLNRSTDVSEEYDGNFSNLLDIAPHMGAFDVKMLSSSNVSVIALYNDTTQHSLPIVLNLFSNALYRMMTGDDFQPIEIRAHPFRQTTQPQEFNLGTFSSALFIGMIFVLIPVSLAVDMVYDREMKAKNQLRVNGLRASMYFSAYFIVLSGLMIIICAALLGMVFIFDIPSFRQPPALFTLGMLVFLYCPAAILCSTCSSYFFDRTDSAQSFLPNILTFIGLIPFILVSFLDMLGIEVQAAIALHYVFSLLNPMYIPYAAVYFVDRVYVACRLSSACAELSLADYMTEEVIVMGIGAILHVPIWALCLRIVDISKTGGKVRDAFRSKKKLECDDNSSVDDVIPGEYEDNDVRNERARINRLCTEQQHNAATVQPVVIVRNLRKEYRPKTNCCVSNCCCCLQDESPKRTKVAVRCLSIGVDAGEVLGLLGHNGAGKTTTMRIMTGETAPSRGQVKIGGHNITINQDEAFRTLGYCPQHDALWKNITVREHLEVYAAIRGVTRKDLPRVINTYLHGLHIAEHANKQTQHCSGGTRRKLSYAMAMVGSPKVVLLDEPSTGMDPKSKRFLWDTILASFQGSRGAILTTHSMEEADALCSRVGIMVKGELRCLGSTQHLKNLYGAGYTLEVKLKHIEYLQTETSITSVNGIDIQPTSFDNTTEQEERTGLLRAFVSDMFPDACLEESFADRLVYSVPQNAVSSLAQCFSKLERAKTELDIEEYSFSQTTLEQVFLKFAHYDEDALDDV